MRVTTILLLTAAAAFPLAGQAPDTSRVVVPPRTPPTVTLGLREALERARASSPAYLQVVNNEGPARWAVKNAYASFLPRVDANASLGYQGAGTSTFGGSLFNQQSASLTSGYSLSMGLTLDGSTILGPSTQKAALEAVESDIDAAARTVEADVTLQYLGVLQAVAQVDVGRQQIVRNQEFLDLAQARFDVGQGTLLDVRQAQVTLGQSRVELLRLSQSESEAKLELLRRMGVELPVPVTELGLSDSFPVTEPTFQLTTLLNLAENENPVLRATQARERAAVSQARSAKTQYLPSLNLTAQWSGFTQEFTDEQLLIDQQTLRAQQGAEACQFNNALIGALPGGGVPGYPNGGMTPDCFGSVGLDPSGGMLLPETQQFLVNSNNVWPFDYQGQPFSARLSVSIPIFANLGRNLTVARANAERQDAEELVRATRLRVRSDIQGRHLGVLAAYEAIGVQEDNRLAAREQLELAQERFRVGSGSALEVTDAQAAVTRAEADYVNAVYAYHRSIADLEYAVGRPLR